MKRKNYFFGKYYKFINNNHNFSFSVIDVNSNEGHSYQIIFKDKAYFVNDESQIKVNKDSLFFNVKQDDLTLTGEISFINLNPLKRKVMGPFSIIPFMECKHDIYSMYHDLKGKIYINNSEFSFDDGVGYIEGDKGTNFPKKYIWYNSTLPSTSLTFAIATIPLGFVKFIGILGFIKTNDKEYYLSTYNFAKLVKSDKDHITIKKHNYVLDIKISFKEGHNLKAPIKGDMSRYIKENVAVYSSYTLSYKNKIILSNEDPLSSYEWVFD